MCRSMVAIHSATAEIRRGKEKKKKKKAKEENKKKKKKEKEEEEERKKETTGQNYNVRICYAEQP